MKTSSFILPLLVALLGPRLSFGERVQGSSSSANGNKKRDLQLEIVGGDDTTFGDHPYYVALTYFGLVCGASLVWEDIVLKAAHCNGAGISTARVGPNQQSLGIEKGTQHPDYNSNTLSWDFMVLKLDSSALSSGATIIDLESNDNTLSDGDDLVVVGLGATSEGGAGSDGLMEVTVDYIPNSDCNDLYDGGITDAMLCAGVDGGGKDSCQGDSGGPIFQGSTQVGVVSWGIGCARPDFPGVYARVSAAYDWIQDMICCHSSNPPSTCGTVDPSECPNTFNGGGGDPSTPPPTPGPVDCDAGDTLFRLEILTDDWPEDISWELTNDCTSDVVMNGGGNYQPNAEHVEQQCLKDGQQYTFNINDSYGDGLCCDYGLGEYRLVYGPNELRTGGEYGDSESTTFGACRSTTNSPTRSPTPSPTSSPTTSPSRSPTGSPTQSSNSSPTSSPTNSPTSSPSQPPTQSPTTSTLSCPACDDGLCQDPQRCLYQNCDRYGGLWYCSERKEEDDGNTCAWNSVGTWKCQSCTPKGNDQRCCKGCIFEEGGRCGPCDDGLCGNPKRCLYQDCRKEADGWYCNERKEEEDENDTCVWNVPGTAAWKCQSCVSKGNGLRCCMECTTTSRASNFQIMDMFERFP